MVIRLRYLAGFLLSCLLISAYGTVTIGSSYSGARYSDSKFGWDNILFGTFAQECIPGKCVMMYKLDYNSGKLYVDSSNDFLQTPWGEKIDFKSEIKDKTKIAVAQDIANSIPGVFANSEKDFVHFNCAGCGDERVLYFQITSGNVIKRFIINYNLANLPKEVQAFGEQLKKGLAALK